jgi:hypothetical protein
MEPADSCDTTIVVLTGALVLVLLAASLVFLVLARSRATPPSPNSEPLLEPNASDPPHSGDDE